MTVFEVFWTETALRQRNFVFNYWNSRNQSTTYSKKLNNKIRERIKLLKNSPEMGKKTDLKQYRVLSLGHYSIVYKISNSKIYIVSFWDNRQDQNKLMKFLTGN